MKLAVSETLMFVFFAESAILTYTVLEFAGLACFVLAALTEVAWLNIVGVTLCIPFVCWAIVFFLAVGVLLTTKLFHHLLRSIGIIESENTRSENEG